MARAFEAPRNAAPARRNEDDDGAGANRSTARLLACAIAALLVSFLVIDRSAAAFRSTSDNSSNHFEIGQVTLSDDDGGAPMFHVPALVPGKPVDNCITVTYAGTIVPATVKLSAAANGALGSALHMRMESGSGGRFGDCSTFHPESTLFEGTLASFTAAHAPKSGIEVFRAVDEGTARSFRFVFWLPEDFDDQGATGNADFEWEVTTG